MNDSYIMNIIKNSEFPVLIIPENILKGKRTKKKESSEINLDTNLNQPVERKNPFQFVPWGGPG